MGWAGGGAGTGLRTSRRGGRSASDGRRTKEVCAPTHGQPSFHHVAPPGVVVPLDAVISLRVVTKSFGSHTVLRDISFDIPRGQITSVMGPSGTGKSVLLKNIIGLLRPNAGEIWVEGEETVAMGERDLYRVRRKFGVLFQDGALFVSMNIYDNIAFPPREQHRKSEKEIREIVLGKAEMVGMLDHMKKYPGEEI